MSYLKALCMVFVCGTLCGTDAEKIFQESAGLVVVEAEDYISQQDTSVRAWYLCNTSTPSRDNEGNFSATASGNAYMEILPDTRRTHNDPLITGQNFQNTPGAMCIINYKVHFSTIGRYYVWARVYSRGPEDNGVHVGINATWPSSGARMQWCNGKHSWYWGSAQRTDAQHCGVWGRIFLDVTSAGTHTISFSMREDGFRMDRWLMTTNSSFSISGGLAAVGPQKSALAEASTVISPTSLTPPNQMSQQGNTISVYSLKGERIDAGIGKNLNGIHIIRRGDETVLRNVTGR